MVSLLPTKFHEILFSSFRGVALINCVTDRTKTICLPPKWGGDIINKLCTKFGQNPLKDADSRVFTRMLQGKN